MRDDRRSWSTLVRYLAVGAGNTWVGLSVIYLALFVFRVSDVTANAIGYAVGITLSFVLNRRWTFASTVPWAPTFVKFVAITGAAYLVNLITVLALIRVLHVEHHFAQALGVIPFTAVGYFGSRYFVFRRPSD